jgi:hypothetical protein
MRFENLNKEDVQLIKDAMMESSVSLIADAKECKEVMPKEAFEKDMDRAKRLVYLVNVLNGVKEYDK